MCAIPPSLAQLPFHQEALVSQTHTDIQKQFDERKHWPVFSCDYTVITAHTQNMHFINIIHVFLDYQIQNVYANSPQNASFFLEHQ